MGAELRQGVRHHEVVHGRLVAHPYAAFAVSSSTSSAAGAEAAARAS